MRIAVIGAGAMGGVFGALLSQGGNEVWLVDVWREHVETIRRDGLWVQQGDGGKSVRINATTLPEEVGKVKLALIFVKSYHTETAARTAQQLIEDDGYALTLQNGVGNAEKIGEVVGLQRVVAGVTLHGATLLGPGRVSHSMGGPTHIGWLDGQATAELHELADTFSQAGIHADVTENVVGMVWSKLIVNVGMNAIAAICRLRNLDVMRCLDSARLSELAIAEAVEVAQRKGVNLIWKDPQKECRAAYLTSSEEHMSSMVQDALAGRRTEIEVINGAVVAEGRRLGVPTPVNETLTLLVKTIEQTYNRRADAISGGE